ncbi:MAG: ABC transporter permease subunit [Proteobacteria bacterium]|nr:ABC transporter permease subunit [Pseudomonadota bacterium]MBU1708736.1 ABC transporter permease subunit [Pseudomonadota bacterium]
MNEKFRKRARRRDNLAKKIIKIGGILVIVSVLAILVLIVRVTLPLFAPSRLRSTELALQLPEKSLPILTIGLDSYQQMFHTLSNDGALRFYSAITGDLLSEQRLGSQPDIMIFQVEQYFGTINNILWQDGRLSMVEIDYVPEYEEQNKRKIVPHVSTIKDWPAPQHPESLLMSLARRSTNNRFSRIDLFTDNTLQITHEVTTIDLFGNEETETFSLAIRDPMPGKLVTMTLDDDAAALYAATDNGYIVRWDLTDPEAYKKTDTFAATTDNIAISLLGMVFGGQSLVVADSEGKVSTWMPVRSDPQSNTRKMHRIHDLAAHKGPVKKILASRRSKTIYTLSEDGAIHADHVTSENNLFGLSVQARIFGLSLKDNNLITLDDDNTLHMWRIDNPHPETSLKTLFGKIWYEGYDQPEYVWQSSAQSDDAEPKLSLVPLIFGTMKGTLYAMLFSVPLAIFGAVYTSQFATPQFKRIVKPVIEIMASIPSVVIGFLIALWLAPIIENSIFPLISSLFLLPFIFTVIMLIIQPLYRDRKFANRIKGYEFVIMLPVLVLTGWLAVEIAPVLEQIFFAGEFKLWLYNDLGMRYDQRNCIIIAFGLGICVIPIIFSITEDAISNIPPSLTAASLALGASRWQTVWRVVLPSASPGIFAAMIIGFGRAVGETMVVLMATGNTPIMDWSVFNGMRTLSANIAVEIPEAPFGGTLYRVLFLCATVLFSLTFVLNTAAEIIRERLRKKYGRY